jgi:hypothetical protein
MKKLALTAALGAACLGLSACGDNDAEPANTAGVNGAEAAGEGNGPAAAGGGGTASAAGSAAFPKGARIVEENGVAWRIDADGTRVRLGDTDSRIVVDNGVRYRVDPGGARVRIDDRGLDIDVPDLTPDLPDVDVGINKKGNPDVDVKDKKDGNDGPN